MADESVEQVQLRWRVGRKVGRTLYLDDKLVGVVDTPELAQELCDAANMRISMQAQAEKIAARMLLEEEARRGR